MSRPTVTQALAWSPASLRAAADAWDAAAADLRAAVAVAVDGVTGSREFWWGAAAEAARAEALAVGHDSDALARAAVLAAVAARDGADQVALAQREVSELVTAARADGFGVADDGTVTAPADPSELLVALSGGDKSVGRDLLALRAEELTRRLVAALDRLAAADADAAADIDEALATATVRAPQTAPASADPQLAAMTPAQLGNTDGVPWPVRIAANRTNIAQAVLDEPDPGRAAFYRSLLAEVDDPTGRGGRIDRQVLAFDPARDSFVELHGDLAAATSVAVLVPGMNTTLVGSPANTATARRFVEAGRGDVAVITYLGGPFPRGNRVTGLLDAASPRYAMDMAPRLVRFSADVDRTVDAIAAERGRPIAVTYIGHSYGGAILGTAEALGLTADRTLYVAAAGAGFGVDDPGDWHNRNPHVVRYSMTAPGDFIQAVQGIPNGPHGADPDTMPGVIPLPTGNYDDGRPMAGWQAHTDVLNAPSDAWRNILAVITGDVAVDSPTLHKAG